MSVRAYVGLGSNLDGPERHVRSAATALAAISDTCLVSLSPLYQSAPLGPTDQPDYINAVAALDTALDPFALLDALQAIELAHGRVRNLRWGPRTLDLDLLLYGDEIIDSERLSVPHPGLTTRAFVLVPLFDVAPGLRLPDGTLLAPLLEACDRSGLRRLTMP